VLTRFANDPTLRLTLKVDVAPTGAGAEQKVQEAEAAIRELGLSEHADNRARVPRSAAPIDVTHLKTIADGAWVTPTGVQEDNLALFALIDVLCAFGGQTESERVRLGTILVRNPVVAPSLMGADLNAQWVRLIGADAKRLPQNVTPLSRFRTNEVDRPWAAAVSLLKAGGKLLQDGATDKWSAGPGLQPSGQAWMEGRAAVVANVIAGLELETAKQKVSAYSEEVQRGTTAKAVS